MFLCSIQPPTGTMWQLSASALIFESEHLRFQHSARCRSVKIWTDGAPPRGNSLLGLKARTDGTPPRGNCLLGLKARTNGALDNSTVSPAPCLERFESSGSTDSPVQHLERFESSNSQLAQGGHLAHEGCNCFIILVRHAKGMTDSMTNLHCRLGQRSSDLVSLPPAEYQFRSD